MYQKILNQFYPSQTLKVAKTAAGYGMALLLVFISSSILVASSTSLLLAPGSSNYMATLSLDQSTANQLAEMALDTAQTDILSQQASGTTITTAYRYPSSGSNTISVPTYPGSGSNVAKGSYYVTATYARGFTFLLKANVTVGANNVAVSRLVQLYDPPGIIDSALAVYSLRKAKSSYTGYAAQVRCASNPSGATTMDIGFDAEGDFDVAGLRTCLGDSTLPLDVSTGEKLAYGLRKLSSSYSNFAIQVRRSSDSFTQDIGFDADGNLDTVSLKTFVGSSSAYVTVWYDQSGSSKDLTQANTSKQPRIVNAGVLEMKNNHPAVYFDGVDDSMSNTALAGTLITGAEVRAFIVSSVESGGNNPSWGEFAVIWKSGDANAYNTSTSMEFLCMAGSTSSNGTQLNGGSAGGSGLTTGTLYQHTSYHDASNNLRLYRNSTLKGSDSVSANLGPTSVIIGTSAGSDASTNGKGYINELIVFNSNLSSTNQQAIERSQGHYYNISGMQDGFVTTWYDQSGNGRNATQATASAQPVLVTAGILFNNGTMKPSIQFDGSNDYLATATSTAWPSGSSDRTLNALYQLNATAGNYIAFGWGSNSTGAYSSIIQNPTVSFYGVSANVTTASAADATLAHRITATKSGSTVTVYRDGVSGATGTPSLNTTSNTALYIGSDAGGGNFMNGNETEILLYTSALSSTQLTQLETNQTSYYGQ